MRTALRLLWVTLFALLAARPILAADEAPNYQGLWWSSPPGSEPGWGLSLTHRGDLLFATWFTYDAAGNPMWMSMDAARASDGSFAGDIVIASAYPARQPLHALRVTAQPVGAGLLAFENGDNGVFRYDVNGLQRTKRITREVFGPQPDCRPALAAELAGGTNYTDLWGASGGAEPGTGVNLSHQGDTLFATWFTYDHVGAPRWMVVAAPRIAGGVYGGKVLRTTGPPLGVEPFDASNVRCAEAGSATFTFAHGNAATLAYTVDGVSHTQAITRRTLGTAGGTLCRTAAAGMVRGSVFAPQPLQARVCADDNGNLRCDPAEAQVQTDAAGRYELAVRAGYAGALVAEVEGRFRMASPSREYSVHITPLTTLVRLAAEPDPRLGELLARNELGLPPRFPILLAEPPSEGTLAHAMAAGVAEALEASAPTLDLAERGALARLAAALPRHVADMPRVEIETRGGAPVDSKEVYVDATYWLTHPATATTTMLKGKIRGRGNFTWLMPKKPYKVQFANDAAYAALADVLGMPKNRNWALLADYLDRTLMRNQLAFALANSAIFADGLRWTPSGVHAEVWLNGEYLGVYFLAEDIRLDPVRLPLRKMGAADQDGGYIAEVDFPLDCYNDGRINLQHVTPMGVRVCVKTPDEESATPAQLAYVKALIDAAESDIYGRAPLDRINPLSFADWYLLQELYRNYDAPFYSSDYLWKDSDSAAVPADRRLNMGPLWDFDIAAGNLGVAEAWRPYGCWVTQLRDGMTNWFTAIFDDRDFLELTLARWKDKRPALERVVPASIEAFARRLEAAQQRNFARWPILEEQTDYGVRRTYADHVGFLRDFLTQRMAWLDRAYESPETFAVLCK